MFFSLPSTGSCYLRAPKPNSCYQEGFGLRRMIALTRCTKFSLNFMITWARCTLPERPHMKFNSRLMHHSELRRILLPSLWLKKRTPISAFSVMCVGGFELALLTPCSGWNCSDSPVCLSCFSPSSFTLRNRSFWGKEGERDITPRVLSIVCFDRDCNGLDDP